MDLRAVLTRVKNVGHAANCQNTAPLKIMMLPWCYWGNGWSACCDASRSRRAARLAYFRRRVDSMRSGNSGGVERVPSDDD